MIETRTLDTERSTSTAHRLTYYDGACGNIHGHNFTWMVEAEVLFDPEDESGMPIDLKDISDVIDETDHAVLLNKDDPLLDGRLDRQGAEQALGDVITFEQDPTCEVTSHWMAKRILNLSSDVVRVDLKLQETKKYGIGTCVVDDDYAEKVADTYDT